MQVLKHRMTNKELARWCALGRGQVCIAAPDGSCGTGLIMDHWQYAGLTENMGVPNNVYVRPWNSNRWDEPYIERAQLEGQAT